MKIQTGNKKTPKGLKWIITLLVLALTLLVLVSISSAEPEDNSLTISYGQYMPFYFEGLNKKPRGILVDSWQLWSEKTGIPVEFILLPWEENLGKVASGSFDINPLMYNTPERRSSFDFSQSILNLSTFLYYFSPDKNDKISKINDKDQKSSNPKPVINKLTDFAHLTFGVVNKDITAIYLKEQLPGVYPIVYNDHESLIKATLNGDIQAFLMEGPVASTYIAKHHGFSKIKKLADPLFSMPLFAGVRKGNIDLVNKINSGFDLIHSDEIDQIVQNWTGSAQPLMLNPYEGSLKIASSIDNMPFHFVDEAGNAVGYFIDLWKLWAQKTGIDIEFISVPWAKSLSMIKNGEADIHAGCFFSVQRDIYLDYAGMLSNCETHFFFHESIFGLKNLEDLKGFKIGVLDQDYASEFVKRELPGAALELYTSHEKLFDGVVKGEVRVFVCDTPTALFFLEKKKLLQKFRYHSAQPLYQKPFYAAVKDGNTRLLKKVNSGFESISSDEWAAIERKWMGTSEENKADGLVVAAARSFPPFSMLNTEGKPSGLFIDMWEQWSKKTGNPVTFRLYEREEAIHALKDGFVDVLFLMTPIKPVKGWTQMSSPHYRFDWYFYYHNRASITNLDIGSTNVVLGAVTGSLAHEWLTENRPDLRVSKFDTTRQMILAAASRRIDGFLALPQEMEILPGRLGLPDSFIQSDKPFVQQPLRAAIRNYNPNLIKKIDKGFESISHSALVQMESRWISDSKARVFNPRSEKIQFTNREKKWLTEHHDSGDLIRLGVHQNWPPFEFVDKDASYKGMVSDYVTLLNKRLGLNMFMASDLTTNGYRRDVDVLPSVASFEKDSSKFLKTDSYLESPWVIINKRQAPLVGSIRDLYGKSIAVINRYAIINQIEAEHPEVFVYPVTNTDKGLEAVLEGKVDAFVENLAIAGYRMQTKNITSLKVAASTDFINNGLTFSVRKDWPELVGIMNKGLATISDQEHDQIRQKWFSVRFEHQVDPAYVRGLIYKIGAGVIFFTMIFLFWSWQIQKRKEAAEIANQSKTKFLASLSHEIRTPLNSILGMTDMTLKTQLNPQQKKNLSTVKDSAQHLLDVITDILYFSTIEAGQIQLQNQTFNLKELLDTIAQTWSVPASEKDLLFDLEVNENVPELVYSDPVRIQQILGNLISNAIKFTEKGKVSLSVKLFRPFKRTSKAFSVDFNFIVEDTGIGIGEEYIETIFTRFTQGEESISRKYGGTGLGLTISRETAELMDGRLNVASSIGKGSRFVLTLPIQLVSQPWATSHISSEKPNDSDHTDSTHPDSTHPDSTHPGPAHSGYSQLSLLIVEDDPINTIVFKSFFEDSNHKIIHAEDGEVALTTLRENHVDIVFMDIEMPRMDGITACRLIREGGAGSENKTIPIIAMSAHVLDEYKEKSFQAGMNAFLAKPVDINHLFKVVQQIAPDLRKMEATVSVPETISYETLIDQNQALASMGGNRSLLSNIFDIFIQETPAQLKAIEIALENKEVDELHRLVHTLKGAAGRIFAEDCVNETKQFKQVLNSGDWHLINNTIAKIIQKFNQLINALQNRHQNNPIETDKGI